MAVAAITRIRHPGDCEKFASIHALHAQSWPKYRSGRCAIQLRITRTATTTRNGALLGHGPCSACHDSHDSQILTETQPDCNTP